MRKNLKRVVEKIKSTNKEAKLEFDVLTKGWTFVFGLVDLKFGTCSKVKINNKITHDFKNEIISLKDRFPEMYNSYLSLLREINRADFNQIISEVASCIISDYNHNWIGWGYQYLKRAEEKEVFRRSLNNGCKISDKELLLTTQFFTESYMIDFLLQTSFNHYEDLSQVRLIDPACGGGNFLTQAFDYFYNYYTKHHPNLSNEKIVSSILNEHLYGYDLDENLAKIGRLSLFLKASKIASINKTVKLNIFNGMAGDKFGFLNKEKLIGYSSTSTKKNDISSLFFNKTKNNIIATNPPFMGIRNMDTYLKNYLQSSYPLSKGDLCAAFIEKCIGHLKNKDILAIVAQNTWLYLKNFKNLRKYLLDNVGIDECIDLGDNAFYDINGSKTSVALTVFTKEKSETSSFFNLRTYPTAEKEIRTIAKKFNSFERNIVSQEVFLKNKDFEIDYIISNFLRKKISTLQKYGEYANAMQGTSTGNNNEFVKYAWEKPNNKNWKIVSKGGSYCKWSGLNIFIVKWGENASLIRSNPGSAIRNLDKIDKAQLVYSDTGTSGINVRLKLANQVFIASGPGIQVNKGNVYCHLAFLNSRIATFFMRILSPKLTISAGYFSKIPIPQQVLFSEEIESKSKECVSKKNAYLKNKLTNFEYKHFDFNSIENLDDYLKFTFLNDLRLELDRLKCEFEIENLIEVEFGFRENEKALISFFTGTHSYSLTFKEEKFDLRIIDQLIYNFIDETCQFTSSKYKNAKVGCEGILERLSIEFKIHPTDLFDYISQNIEEFRKTISRYYFDFLHKIILKEAGFNSIMKFNIKEIDINTVIENIDKDYSSILKTFENEKYNLSTWHKWIKADLSKHHALSFKNKPLFFIANNSKIKPINSRDKTALKPLETII